MTKPIKENDVEEIRCKQRSDEIQYHSLPVSGTGPLKAVLGYRRCLDFDKHNNPGQDFVSCKGDEKHLVGVVADGVSQSFYGDLAALHVSEFLLKLLWEERGSPPSEAELSEELKKEEAIFSKEIIEPFQIPESLNPFLQEALQLTRAKGSQAVFAAFILDISKRYLSLYQVGDIDCIIHYANQLSECSVAPKNGRWSSARKSDLQFLVRQFKAVAGFVIKSDGASKEWGQGSTISKETFSQMAEERAGRDDISFIAVSFESAEMLSPESSLPPENISETEIEAAAGTDIEIAIDVDKEDPLTIQTNSLPPAIKFTSYKGCLKATGGGLPYTWSLDFGTLPKGLQLFENGSISGKVTGKTSEKFGVRVVDSHGNHATKDMEIELLSIFSASTPKTITSLSLTKATAPASLKKLLPLVASCLVGVLITTLYFTTIKPWLFPQKERETGGSSQHEDGNKEDKADEKDVKKEPGENKADASSSNKNSSITENPAPSKNKNGTSKGKRNAATKEAPKKTEDSKDLNEKSQEKKDSEDKKEELKKTKNKERLR